MADGKDHVRVELTFHKTLPTLPVYKKRVESRWQLASSAGEWPRQPTAARRRPPPERRLQHADSRQRRRRRQHRQQHIYYRSTHQLPSQYQDHQRQHRSRHQPSSRNPLHRLLIHNRHRRKSREQTRRLRTLHLHSTFIEEEYLLHEKYDLQDVIPTTYKAIAKAARLPRDDEEINIDLPVYFVYHRDNRHWTLVKGPTSKFYDIVWYEYIEQLYKRGTKQRNSAYWYDALEKSCSDPLWGGGGPPLLRLVPPKYLVMTYSK